MALFGGDAFLQVHHLLGKMGAFKGLAPQRFAGFAMADLFVGQDPQAFFSETPSYRLVVKNRYRVFGCKEACMFSPESPEGLIPRLSSRP